MNDCVVSGVNPASFTLPASLPLTNLTPATVSVGSNPAATNQEVPDLNGLIIADVSTAAASGGATVQATSDSS